MSGMYQINKKDMVPKYFSHQSTLGWTNIRPDKYIRCIYKDNDGIIWAGGYYNLKSYNIQASPDNPLRQAAAPLHDPSHLPWL